jgi:hypothetical protein
MRVELGINSSSYLRDYYQFRWHLVGNLGTDLLIVPVSRLVGLETGVKIITLFIPVLTTLGLLLAARVIHGTIPPTALFAIPFAYGYPFNFGFINFALSMALALLAFAFWLALGGRQRLWLRTILFVPLSCLIWLAHVFGWGALGLLVWSSELIRQRDRRSPWVKSAIAAAVASLPLCLPVFLMFVWRSGDSIGGATVGYFQAGPKALSLLSALRDRWLIWDAVSVGVTIVLIGSAAFDKHLEFSRRLAVPASVLGLVFILMPSQVFGSAYADMRLVPFVLMLAILALRLTPTSHSRLAKRLTLLGMAFLGLRIVGNTLSFAIADSEARERLAALERIPNGASVLSLVGNDCAKNWEMPRHSHLGSFVIARKDGFSNDQWRLAGAHLLRVTYAAAGDFTSDPSELTFSAECKNRILANARKTGKARIVRFAERKYRTADEALERFPRNAFDYVWIIKPEGFSRKSRPELELIWSGRDSLLYKVLN